MDTSDDTSSQEQSPGPTISPVEAAQLQKLRAETELLHRQLRPVPPWVASLKALAGATGMVTALVAVVGVLLSFFHWREAERQRQAVALSGQFAGALENLVSEETPRRLAGAVFLRRFLEPEYAAWHGQALESLTSLLAVETSPLVRDEILSALRSIRTGEMEEGVLRDGVRSLVEVSRALVEGGNLTDTRTTGSADLDDLLGVEARAQSVGRAIIQLLRAGAKPTDLASIYCLGCDFSSLELSGVSFDNAILYLSNFRNARLDSASFDGADLAGTTFIDASLRGARITFIEDDWLGAHRSTYVSRLFMRMANRQFGIFGPAFSCADLRGAVFTGFPIFGFTAADADVSPLTPKLILHESSFVGANLAGTSFEKARIFVSKRHDGPDPFPRDERSSDWEPFEYTPANSVSTGFEPPAEYHHSLQAFRASFAGSNWREARFPPAITAWLARNAPPPQPEPGADRTCAGTRH